MSGDLGPGGRPAVTTSTARPEGGGRTAPGSSPAPGMFWRTMFGWPGMCLEKNGAKTCI